MFNLSISKIGSAVKGRLYVREESLGVKVRGVSIDTRMKEQIPGSLFVAIKGENFDGHDYIEEALALGAACIITEKELKTQMPYVLVDSTQAALLALASFYRSLFPIPAVAITGSTGKTTTKDIIASVLEMKYRVVKTEGNFNNQIGLPMTIFTMDWQTEVLVVEMGMNSFGEISSLSKIVRPDICVITNIGVAHIENLGSREGILQAKSEIFDYMNVNGWGVLNGDDELLETLSDKPFKKHFFSMNNNSDKMCVINSVQYNGIYGESFQAVFNKNTYHINLRVPGKHMIYNAMAAIIVGDLLGVGVHAIAEGISNFNPSSNRMEIIEKPGGYRIINDVYNANPASMAAAIEVLTAASNKKICILGDMLELGKNSPAMHYQLGCYVALKGIDEIICIGSHAKNIFVGACDKIKASNLNAKASYYQTKEEFLQLFNSQFGKNDTILVKASRSMGFEDIIDKLQ